MIAGARARKLPGAEVEQPNPEYLGAGVTLELPMVLPLPVLEVCEPEPELALLWELVE